MSSYFQLMMSLGMCLEIGSAQAGREVDGCHHQHMARVYLAVDTGPLWKALWSALCRLFLSRVLFFFCIKRLLTPCT